MEAHFSERLLQFLQTSIPTFSAAELLLFLHGHSETWWTSEDIVEAIKPTVISISAIKEYLDLFKNRQLIKGDSDRGYQFSPASPELRVTIEDLSQAYNERPVTLIRTISAMEQNTIQSFADSFKLKGK